MHLAIGAVVNAALGPLRRRRAGKPLWRLLSELSPEQIVDLVDFRYLTDALTPEEALAILERSQPTRPTASAALLAGRLSRLHDLGRLARLSATTSSPGSAARPSPSGFTHLKLKVGARPRGRHPPAADRARA